VIARLARGIGGLALVAAFGVLLVWLSSRPLGAAPDTAAVRLALRTALAHVEVCRDRTAEELAALPAHMRQPRVCEDRRPDYRLELRADGERVLARRVAPPGVHRDRPLTVDELVPIAPGKRRVEVLFAPDATPHAAAGPGAAVRQPPSWHLDCSAELTRGRILLVLLDGAELRVAGGTCSAAAAAAAASPPSPATPPAGPIDTAATASRAR
jgi:hypothetical protein